MTAYCDASVIVAALTAEPATAKAQRWLATRSDDGLSASLWVDTDVAGALARKQRERALTSHERAQAFARWRDLRAGWHMLPVEDAHFTGASALTTLGLRAGDALHLAIALDHGIELATGDRLLARVAAEHGVTVHAIGLDG